MISKTKKSKWITLGVGLSACFTLWLGGCAHSKGGSEKNIHQDYETSQKENESLDAQADDAATQGAPELHARMTPQGEIWVDGKKLENTQFDFPIVINSRVEYWIDYFNGKGRKHFERYLERSELFIPYIVPILRQHNVPEDLVYLAMIESGFNNHAKSIAKAVGPWQFMPFTGKRYGLMVNWWVDERRDTRKSTLSALQYLKDLYSIFKSWELASAAYNAGEAKIARAIRRYGTTDFWSLARHKFLRPETRNYVPKIMAAAIVAKNRTQFGFPASNIKPGENEAISGDGEVVRLEKSDLTQEAQEESESLKSVIDTGDLLPGETKEAEIDREGLAKLLENPDYNEYENAPTQVFESSPIAESDSSTNKVAAEAIPLARAIPTPKVSKTGEINGEVLMEFEVQSPADMLKVARAAGLSYHTIKALNPEVLRWCTPPSVSTYRIKLPLSAREQFLRTYNHEAFPRKVNFLIHKVRRGDTIQRIARHYGIRSDPVVELNRISAKAPLRVGSSILLPLPKDRSRSMASLDVRDAPDKRIRRVRYRPTQKITYQERQKAVKRSRKL